MPDLEWSDISWPVVIGSVIALLVVNVVFLPAVRRAGLLSRLLWGRIRTAVTLPDHLEAYRQRLEADLFRVHHDWMQQDHLLKDVLVPVNVITEADDGSGESVVDFGLAAEHLLSGESGRLMVVLGEPGAGKSVALKVAVRRAWSSLSRHDRLPVHLTFAALRKADFDVVGALPDALTHHGFPDAELARQTVAERLASAGLLVIIDGLDELPLDARTAAVKALVKFGGDHREIPVIIGCRTVPYRALRSQLVPLGPKQAMVAPFSDVARRAFVRHWRFDGRKSAAELLEAIERQPHLVSLSRNPLSLTIIAFLYSQPLYQLPENRARFYALCARALLEEWDNTQAVDRANQIVRQHKEAALAALALEHLDGPNPEADIPEHVVEESIAGSLRSRGIKGQMGAVALREIRDNAGLLVPIPHSGLRFPHQTFLEFFAALALHQANDVDGLLTRWRSDPERWKEVLLLFVGLRGDLPAMDRLIAEVVDADVELALDVMLDAAAISDESADRVFAAVERGVAQRPTARMVEALGFMARNPVSSHDERAYRVVANVFGRLPDRQLSTEVADATVLAVSRVGKAEDMQRLVDEFGALRLGETLPRMGSAARVLAIRVVRSGGLGEGALEAWIEHLRQAGLCDVIFEVWCAAERLPHVQYAAAFALSRLSMTAEWHGLLDAVERVPPTPDGVAEIADGWGWRGAAPESPVGRQLATRVAVMTGQVLSGEVEVRYAPGGGQAMYWQEMPEMHRFVAYLAHATVPVEQLGARRRKAVPDDAHPAWKSVAGAWDFTRRRVWRVAPERIKGAHNAQLHWMRYVESLVVLTGMVWGVLPPVAAIVWALDGGISTWFVVATAAMSLVSIFTLRRDGQDWRLTLAASLFLPWAVTFFLGRMLICETRVLRFVTRATHFQAWERLITSPLVWGPAAFWLYCAEVTSEVVLASATLGLGLILITSGNTARLLGLYDSELGAHLDPPPDT